MSIYFYPTVPNKYVYFQEVYMLAYKIIKTLLDIQLDTYNFPSALIGIPLIVYYHHLFFFFFFFQKNITTILIELPSTLRTNMWYFTLDLRIRLFDNSFCFLFSKTCFWEYKEKTIFLYFRNQKHVWLVEIKRQFFEEKNRKY